VSSSSGVYSGKPALNVYEIEPTVSVLDIYYETSTNGRIDLLNKAIDDGPAPNQFSMDLLLINFLDLINFLLQDQKILKQGTT
jgi:hypothetical protein